MSDYNYAEANAHVTAAIGALERELDPASREQELTTKLADYLPGGRFSYAPDAAKRDAERLIREEQDTRAGYAVVDLHDRLAKTEGPAERAIERTTEAPDPLTAWRTWRGPSASVTGPELLGMTTNHELRLARFDREFASAQPSEVRSAYERALEDPFEQANASLISFIERRFGDRWRGATVTSELEFKADEDLRTLIGESRSARIPPDARALRESLRRGSALKAHAMDARGIRPVRRQP
jgi:hypothetical protein